MQHPPSLGFFRAVTVLAVCALFSLHAAETLAAPPTAAADHLSGGSSPTSADPSLPFDDGGDYFIDVTGQRRPFHAVNQVWFPPYGRRPHYTRAFAEMGVLLALGTIYYWARPSINEYDWDLPTLRDRLTFHAVRFDNNLALTNFVSHPFAGSTYYGAARLNGLSVPESALYAIFTSAFWEYVLEFREQVSINDMIFTPAGGIPIGAFFAQLTDYVRSAPGGDSVGNRIASSTVGLPRLLHSRDEDPNQGVSRLPPDSLGFSSAFWHRFRLGYELSSVAVGGHGTSNQSVVAADGEIVGMPGFLRPGRFKKLFAADTFSELHARVAFTPSSLVQVRSSATLVGAYQQDFRAAPHGTIGHAEMVGLNTGVRYTETRYSGAHDMYASTPLFGLSFGSWLGMGALKARILADVRYDFAAARSLALPAFLARHGDTSVKSVLTVQGYQFEMGVAGRARAELEAYGFTLGGHFELAHYDALNGLDRTQETTRDVNAYDKIGEYGVFVRQVPEHVPIFIAGFIDWLDRASLLGDMRATRLDTRVGVAAGLAF